MTQRHKQIFLLIRIILAMIFLISGYYKLRDPVLFAQSVQNYQIVDNYLSYWAAIFIPMLELMVGILLLSGFWLRESICLTLGLYILFDLMILQAAIRGLDISCGCFNPSQTTPLDVWKFMQNAILTALAGIGCYFSVRTGRQIRTKQ